MARKKLRRTFEVRMGLSCHILQATNRREARKQAKAIVEQARRTGYTGDLGGGYATLQEIYDVETFLVHEHLSVEAICAKIAERNAKV